MKKKVCSGLFVGILLSVGFASPAYAYTSREQASYIAGCQIAWFFGLNVCAELRKAQ